MCTLLSQHNDYAVNGMLFLFYHVQYDYTLIFSCYAVVIPITPIFLCLTHEKTIHVENHVLVAIDHEHNISCVTDMML